MREIGQNRPIYQRFEGDFFRQKGDYHAPKLMNRSASSFKKSEIEERLNRALKLLIDQDRYLLEKDAHERTLCSRLAIYLTCIFEPEGFFVDCEYNLRNHKSPKWLKFDNILRKARDRRKRKRKAKPLRPNAKGKETITVFPDIIIHRRGPEDPSENNLLVIETKKSTSIVSSEYDKAKLHGYIREFTYSFAVAIVLCTGEHFETRQTPYRLAFYDPDFESGFPPSENFLCSR